MYGEFAEAVQLSEQDLSRFQKIAAAVQPFTDTALRFDRLERVFTLPGASAGALAGCHYVVEMDPAPGWEEELFRWYDTEHMPGLAAAPGCVRAQRFLNRDGGPFSYACYDLTAFNTLESAPWLRVRRTAWSDRVRPQFRNTRRTKFRAVVDSTRKA